MTSDYLMRQIETMTRALAVFVLCREELSVFDFVDEDSRVSPELFLRYSMEKLLAEGKIGQAEDLLFRMIEETPDPGFLTVGLMFYQKLLEMDEETLRRGGFTQEEIGQGLEDLARHFPQTSEETE